jgi:hypothetical protein
MHAINLLSYIFFSQFSFLSVSAALIYTHTHTHLELIYNTAKLVFTDPNETRWLV